MEPHSQPPPRLVSRLALGIAEVTVINKSRGPALRGTKWEGLVQKHKHSDKVIAKNGLGKKQTNKHMVESMGLWYGVFSEEVGAILPQETAFE